jgi:predicted DNA-binding protein YlxM (UPF0122 family)
MRYIPQSKYSFEEICEQCRSAINRPVENTQHRIVSYNDILHFYRRKDNVLVAR